MSKGKQGKGLQQGGGLMSREGFQQKAPPESIGSYKKPDNAVGLEVLTWRDKKKKCI